MSFRNRIPVFVAATNALMVTAASGYHADSSPTPEADLLVFIGADYEASWRHTSGGGRAAHTLPLVVDSVRPRLGAGIRGLLRTDPNRIGLEDNPLSPRWYKCIWLPDVACFVVSWHISHLTSKSPLGSSIHLNLGFEVGKSADIACDIDEHGTMIDGSFLPGEDYSRDLKSPDSQYPSASLFKLRILPELPR